MIKNRVRYLTYTALFLSFYHSNLHAESLTIGTGDGRPYIFVKRNVIDIEKPGFSIEIVNAISDKLDWGVQYAVMPFSRQVVSTQKGETDALMAVFKSDAPDLVYPDEPIGVASNCFFKREDNDFHFPDRRALDEVRIGVTNGFTYGLIDEFVAENRFNNIVTLSGDDKDVVQRLITMTLEGKIDTFIEAEAVVNYHLQEKHIKDLVNAGCTRTFKAYIAFSPVKPGSVQRAKRFDQAMTELRMSGELAMILAKYGTKDWKNPHSR